MPIWYLAGGGGGGGPRGGGGVLWGVGGGGGGGGGGADGGGAGKVSRGEHTDGSGEVRGSSAVARSGRSPLRR
jgi:hypothetical protein